MLTKNDARATLSTPNHLEVKRTIIAKLISLAGITREQYIKEFHK